MCLFFCCLGGGRLFFAVWARGVLFFLLFGRGRVFFLLFGRGRVLFFAVWAGGVFFFLLFRRGTGVHSLTRLPGSSLSDPTTKETEQQKQNTGSGPSYLEVEIRNSINPQEGVLYIKRNQHLDAWFLY